MALSDIATTVRNLMMDEVSALLDSGGAGTLEFQTSGDVEVATLTFSATAFGAASGGVVTAAAITSDTSATGGTIAKAAFKNNVGTTLWKCTVTATGGGGDIELASLVIGAGATVGLTSLTMTAPT